MNIGRRKATIEVVAHFNGNPLRFVTTMPKGWIRIGTRPPQRLDANTYPDIDVALARAWEALGNARSRTNT